MAIYIQNCKVKFNDEQVIDWKIYTCSHEKVESVLD